MSAQHTPGPWVAEPSGDIRASMQGTGVGFVIASMNGRNGADEIRANAKLIAAAPELLSAAKWALDFVAGLTTGCTMDEQRDIHQRLSAAIAKAESK